MKVCGFGFGKSEMLTPPLCQPLHPVTTLLEATKIPCPPYLSVLQIKAAET